MLKVYCGEGLVRFRQATLPGSRTACRENNLKGVPLPHPPNEEGLQGPGILWERFQEWARKGATGELVFDCPAPGQALRGFATQFTMVEAAGGLVLDHAGRIMMIHRQGKWDLPKGKMDPGESPAETAMREVREECGIGRLTISAPLPDTLHVYPAGEARWMMKKTHWFLMRSDWQGQPRPQAEEDIARAEWIPPESVNELLPEAFRSVADLLHATLPAGGAGSIKN
jgi:8-oxo-dGTP pyrophosphatase MutT (NUDIX family)